MKFFVIAGFLLGIYITYHSVNPTIGDYLLDGFIGAVCGAAVRQWFFRKFWA